jgi:hypothetical protein
MARCGTTTRYRDGCRCVKCKAANSAAARRVRARNSTVRARRSKSKIASVVAMPTNPQSPGMGSEMGRCERAVRDECDTLERAVDRPSVVAAAIVLAQRLDDPSHAAMSATNSRQLQSLMSELQVPKKKLAPKRLAAVQQMVARR